MAISLHSLCKNNTAVWMYFIFLWKWLLLFNKFVFWLNVVHKDLPCRKVCRPLMRQLGCCTSIYSYTWCMSQEAIMSPALNCWDRWLTCSARDCLMFSISSRRRRSSSTCCRMAPWCDVNSPRLNSCRLTPIRPPAQQQYLHPWFLFI